MQSGFLGGNGIRHRFRSVLIIVLLALAAAAAVDHYFKITIHNRWEGIYILRCANGKPYELKDDIYLGDGYRLVWGMTFWLPKHHWSLNRLQKEAPCLYYEWDDGDGKGFVRNFLPDGKRISISFSRFNYAQKQQDIGKGMDMHGLFIGGGLPAAVSSNKVTLLNETGMAYWNGKRWYHLWCSVNEGIAPADTKEQIPPNRWKFLGSRVLQGSRDKLAITSAHEIEVQGQPLRMDRYVYLKAGNRYIIFSIRLTNTGDGPLSYYYSYGDEPWLGDFGSSEGNVGWVKDGLVTSVQQVDTSKYNYLGFFDYGNKTKHDYTWAANFIEWFGDNVPAAYFSNSPAEFPPGTDPGEPLSGDSRFIGLQWGPTTLAPGERTVYVFAVGMANNDPATGFPVIPEIKLRAVPQ